jgi:hypothetical protein
MKRIIASAVVMAMAVLLPGRTAAAPNPFLLNLTVSGTMEVQTNFDTTNKTESDVDISKVMTFNTKYVYRLISNAVANAYGNLGTNLTPTNLPADGYIAFNIRGYDNPDGDGNGTFYVTNKSGFYYPLSGYDTNSQYYSFIEFDDNDFDFNHGFGYAENGSTSDKTGVGKYTIMQPSVFYVHDDPYEYDDAENTRTVFNNYMALEVRSNIKALWTMTNNLNTANTDTTSGGACGTVVINGSGRTSVLTGKITLSP